MERLYESQSGTSIKCMNSTQEQFNPTRFAQLERASFLRGAAALENFQAWNAQIDWREHLNADEYRLLPQLFRNLSAQQVQHPLLGKLGGIARKAWYDNQLFFHRLAPSLHELHAAHIETLLLYGGALALRYDREYVLSQGADCGILVRSSDARRAFQQLRRLGWHARLSISERALERYLQARYFHTFQNTQGERLVLQWQLFPHCDQNDFDAEFWRCAQETTMNGVPVFTLHPTAQLLHTCVYGARTRGATRWQRESQVLLLWNAASWEMDWEQFLKQMQTQRVTLPVRQVLLALSREFDLPVPSFMLEKIKTLSVSADEQREQSLWNATTRRERIAQLWYLARRRSCATNGFQQALHFPNFLQSWWGLEHLADLPRRALIALLALGRAVSS